MSCLTPFYVKVMDRITGDVSSVKVPCGKCPSCLSRKRASWSFRLFQEYLASESAWFVTLTYDNDHLPLEGVNKRDVQLFFKRFRKKLVCRFYLTAEYGDQFSRPHYHALLFFPKMVELPEVVKCVSDAWQNGNIQVGSVTLASINYCSKYSLKTRYDDLKLFPNKTFALMSRRPGIGASWLTERNIRVHKEDLDPTANLDCFTYYLPRYYQDKIFDELDKYEIKQKFRESDSYFILKDYGKFREEKQDPRENGREFITEYERLCKRSSKR